MHLPGDPAPLAGRGYRGARSCRVACPSGH